MIEIRKVSPVESLTQLKEEYLAQSIAPLDGMWIFGFVPMAQHFGFYDQGKLVGFCCINCDGYLLQFYFSPNSNYRAGDLFTLIVEQNSSVVGKVNGAFVSTAEPIYLCLCLDNYSTFNVNALMYQMKKKGSYSDQAPLPLIGAVEEQLSQFVEFAKRSIGAPEEWVTGYYANLISRGELFGYWDGNQLIATGECRLFDKFQSEYADLGMVVAPSERGKGLATRVMSFLIAHARQQGLIPICSTEKSNIGAQKAISRAGLSAEHRIIRFQYEEKS